MKTIKILTAIICFFNLSLATNGQVKAIDEKLLVGKWKFVQATRGSLDNIAKYNGEPVLIFVKDGSWITEDKNPYYQQSGTWKIEGDSLIRDPAKNRAKI